MIGWGSVVDKVLGIVDKFIPDPAAKAKFEAELREGLFKWDAAQLEVNKVEAAHRTVFVAGWRPFIGWTCGVALCFHYVLAPIIHWAAAYMGSTVTVPQFDMTTLTTILMGMLGLGGLRTYEKMKGLTK